jgi:hypothetical protein
MVLRRKRNRRDEYGIGRKGTGCMMTETMTKGSTKSSNIP